LSADGWHHSSRAPIVSGGAGASSTANDSYLFRDAIAEAETLPEAIQEKIGRELHCLY
jgi:hypothetical protein